MRYISLKLYLIIQGLVLLLSVNLIFSVRPSYGDKIKERTVKHRYLPKGAREAKELVTLDYKDAD